MRRQEGQVRLSFEKPFSKAQSYADASICEGRPNRQAAPCQAPRREAGPLTQLCQVEESGDTKRGHAVTNQHVGAIRCWRRPTRAVSSRLLERGATMTLACSSTLKLAHLNSGST